MCNCATMAETNAYTACCRLYTATPTQVDVAFELWCSGDAAMSDTTHVTTRDVIHFLYTDLFCVIICVTVHVPTHFTTSVLSLLLSCLYSCHFLCYCLCHFSCYYSCHYLCHCLCHVTTLITAHLGIRNVTRCSSLVEVT